jgi:hypothetical protein
MRVILTDIATGLCRLVVSWVITDGGRLPE